MPINVQHNFKSPEEVRLFAARLPRILSGKEADPHKIAEGIAARIAVAFFELVKDAFIEKSRGGTDEAGIKWPPLSRSYLAYGRSGVRALRWKDGRRIGTDVGGKAPGKHPDGRQYNGYMSDDQLKQWYGIYKRQLAKFSKKEPGNLAKEMAAKVAWSAMKRAGVKTKWDELGTRTVEILRDTGLLINSLQPGIISEAAGTAQYAPAPNQIMDFVPGRLVVGTSVSYAAYHQNAKSESRRRLLWPAVLPPAWKEHIDEQAKLALIQAIIFLAQNN